MSGLRILSEQFPITPKKPAIINENHEFLIVVAGPGGLVIVDSARNDKDAEAKAANIARENLKNNSQVMVFNRTASFKAEISVVKVA